MKKIVMAVAISLGLFTACSDDEVLYDPVKAGETYYPLQVGNSWTYDVTDITYRNNVGDTATYQLKEEVDTVITDQTGKSWYRIQLSRKRNGETQWSSTGLRFISRSISDLRINENNQTKVHMVFPVQENKTWNANAYNAGGTAEYRYEKVGSASVVNGTTINNTATIVKAFSIDSLLANNKQWDVMAEGIGPVYRFYNVVNYCSGGAGSECKVGEFYITEGRKRVEVLTSHSVTEK